MRLMASGQALYKDTTGAQVRNGIQKEMQECSADTPYKNRRGKANTTN